MLARSSLPAMLLAAATLVGACGGSGGGGSEPTTPAADPGPEPVGEASPLLEEEYDAADPGPVVDLVLRDEGGNFFDLGEYRGRPTLLFFFTTFDAVSQAAIRPVQRFARDQPECHVLGVAVQPDAGPFLEVYRQSLQPSYRLAFDPDGALTGGTSALGELPGVPLFVMLDARGRLIGAHLGFPNTHTLETLYQRAAAAAEFFEREQPPLFGRPL